MNHAEVLEIAKASGVMLRVQGGKIIAGPKGALTDDLRALIRANKGPLLEALTEKVTPVTLVTDSYGEGHRGDYSPDDLEEMDRLLRELAVLEGWSAQELSNLLDERQRMAPANVKAMLLAVRAARRAALAPWPNPPTKRSCIRLCKLTVIDGGKGRSIKHALAESA